MTAAIVAELSLALVATVAFLVLFGVRTPWRVTAMGRHLMAYASAWALEMVGLLCLALGIALPLWVYVLIFAAVDAVTLQRFWLLWRAQRAQTVGGDMVSFGTWLAQRRKGIAAFVAFVAIAVQQTLPLTPTQHGWAALIAAAAGFAATYGIKNETMPAPPTPPKE